METVPGPCVKLVVRSDDGDGSGEAVATVDLWCVSNSAATFVVASSGQQTPLLYPIATLTSASSPTLTLTLMLTRNRPHG